MKFVFCEGGDDLAVITGVAGSIGLADVRIEPFLGKDKLRSFLKDVQTRPEFSRNMVTAVGIVRDADEDGIAAFQSVRDALPTVCGRSGAERLLAVGESSVRFDEGVLAAIIAVGSRRQA